MAFKNRLGGEEAGWVGSAFHFAHQDEKGRTISESGWSIEGVEARSLEKCYQKVKAKAQKKFHFRGHEI